MTDNRTAARTLRVARALHRRFANPQTAAHNRYKSARNQRSRMFWLRVIDFLFKPYPGMSWTDDDIRRWNLIRAEAA